MLCRKRWMHGASVRISRALALCLVTTLMACTVHQTAPGVYVPAPPSKFDRSWSAVLAALKDEGVQIHTEDRVSGRVSGRRGGIDLTVNVRRQADGSVRVEFNTRGTTRSDPGLIERVTDAYHYHMGR